MLREDYTEVERKEETEKRDGASATQEKRAKLAIGQNLAGKGPGRGNISGVKGQFVWAARLWEALFSFWLKIYKNIWNREQGSKPFSPPWGRASTD